MDAAIKKKWVRALRSGKYKQGRGQLRRGNKYCCLGVLCELAFAAGATRRTESREVISSCPGRVSSFSYGSSEQQTGLLLPADVQLWAGIECEEGGIVPLPKYGELNRSLTAINDAGIKFKTIASLIEKHL